MGAAGIGDQAGYVKMSCFIGSSGDLCNTNLSPTNISYVPFGEWNADYNGSKIISGSPPGTEFNVKLIARDNSGKIREEQPPGEICD
jgi:hypothetical protein